MTGSFLDALKARTHSVVQEAAQQQEEREGPRCESEWVQYPLPEGEDGQTKKIRIQMRLTLVKVLGPFTSQWGDRFGYFFHEEGSCNLIVWWSASHPKIEVGETDTFFATIERHDEYEGEKQTVVARVKKVNPELEAAKARRKKRTEEGEGEES